MVRHFKNKESYRKFKAYIKIHGIKTNPREKYVMIAGKRHMIKRTTKRKRR